MKDFLRSPKMTMIATIIGILAINFYLINNLFISIMVIIFSSIPIFFVGYYRYLCFSNKREETVLGIRYLLGFIPVYDMKVKTELRVRKSDFLISHYMMFVIAIVLKTQLDSILSIESVSKLLQPDTLPQMSYAFTIFFIILVIIFYQEIWTFLQIIFRYKTVFWKLKDFIEISPIENEGFKYHHKGVFLIEDDYKDYCNMDLIREKIYLEGKLERLRKPAFYDVYVLPLMIIFVTGIISVFNMYISNLVKTDVNHEWMTNVIFMYAQFSITILVVLLSVSFMTRRPSYRNLEDLRTRVLVLENLLSQKN